MSNYTSYLSNILTQTTSRYTSLRRILLKDENDGDTEDDSHISRVLRAYYTEKGRPFPPWLPPDPNDRRAISAQPSLVQSNSYFGGAIGGRNPYSNAQQPGMPTQRGSLNDLWDAPSPAPTPTAPQSLRVGRRPAGARPEPGNLAPPQARPLPSQRAGSYQSIQSQGTGRNSFGLDSAPPPGSSGNAGGTAQERLKARLWGRSGSPGSPMLNASGPSNPYDQQDISGSSNPGGSSGSSRRFGRIG